MGIRLQIMENMHFRFTTVLLKYVGFKRKQKGLINGLRYLVIGRLQIGH
jgi:hypothetical protein